MQTCGCGGTYSSSIECLFSITPCLAHAALSRASSSCMADNNASTAAEAWARRTGAAE